MSGHISRRDFVRQTTAGLATLNLLAVTSRVSAQQPSIGAGDTLYNGIQLPDPWPPATAGPPPDLPNPWYLTTRPAVIPIDLGRQLFVDDFLIDADKTTLQRAHHQAEYHPGNPLLKPDKPWEAGNDANPPCAMPFSDGVWYDPRDKLFKMWYMAGAARHTCYAVSQDGLQWQKPELDVSPGTNIVFSGPRDSSTVWLDHEEQDPNRRFKMFRSCKGGSTVEGSYGLATHFSPDGIHWSDPPLLTGSCGDRSTVFWNPFRKLWVYSLRHGWGLPRRRRYWEAANLETGPKWQQIGEPRIWVSADNLDPQRDDLKVPAQLYNLDCIAYESLLLGLFTIWRGQPENREKPNELCIGYSRDGWSWSRPDRRPFCPVSETPGDWNFSNVQSAGGCCLVVGDKLYFYVSGRGGTGKTRLDGQSSVTSLATLRRDGFVSMNAGADAGILTTHPVRFSGRHLFVNAAAKEGELRAEILNEAGQPIPPFTLENCSTFNDDKTAAALAWKGADNLRPLVGQPVRIRFSLRNGQLYSFWVTSDPSGASYGFVAAGGPAFAGPRDRAPF